VIQGGCGRPFVIAGFVLRVGAAGENATGTASADARATNYRTTPSRGELAVAYNFFGIRPDR
jgi:hypothetical protein